MSTSYVAVTWNGQKKRYDAVVTGAVIGSVGIFGAVTALAHPTATIETILIRGIGLTAFVLLHVILAIGPLTRLAPRFLPLLYNRRHLGVTLGLLAVAHAALAVFQFHALGDQDPLVSVLTANPDWNSLANFPFEWFGIVALAILFLMAATSHDYWLSVLTPPIWKRLHMLVYLAYVALVLHVALGALQDERHPLYLGLLAIGAMTLGILHVVAARRETPRDLDARSSSNWVDVCSVDDIAESRAKIGVVAGERVAVFRDRGRLSCVSNVCKHQNGPLGEGRIVDGCITCPWHGYQYRPADGRSPPPFNDSIPTFNLRVESGRVLVDSRPNPPGTHVEPVPVEGPPRMAADAEEFFVGYHPAMPRRIGRTARIAAVTIPLLAGVLLGTFALAQTTFQVAAFEYGSPTTVEGNLRLTPYPVLEVGEPGSSIRRYLLAGSGKHGAGPSVAPTGERRVRLTGQLAYRDNLSLLEVASVESVGPASVPAAAPTDLGTFRLVGEVADSKCYAGVMNPGVGKTHRGCAARCLSGGTTPLFVAADSTGTQVEMLLVGREMQPLPDLAPLAGRRMALTGRVWRLDDLWFFQLDRT